MSNLLPLILHCIILLVAALNATDCVAVCFQKNEREMLANWLSYYSAIFGEGQLLVLDNGSSDKLTLDILRQWEDKGVHVHYNVAPYSRKAYLILDNVRYAFPKAKILIYADADELLVAYHQVNEMIKPTFMKSAIFKELALFDDDKKAGALLMLPSFTSVPTSTDSTLATVNLFQRFFYSPNHCKVLYKLSAVKKLDHGNHYAHIRTGYKSEVTLNLGYLHYHNRNPLQTVKRAIRNAIGLRQLPSGTTIETLAHHKSLIHLLASNQHTQGYKKLKELSDYLTFGISALFINASSTELDGQYEILPHIDEIIDLIGHA